MKTFAYTADREPMFVINFILCTSEPSNMYTIYTNHPKICDHLGGSKHNISFTKTIIQTTKLKSYLNTQDKRREKEMIKFEVRDK